MLSVLFKICLLLIKQQRKLINNFCTYPPPSFTPVQYPGLVPGIEFNSISRPTLVHASTCLVVSRRTGHSTSFSRCTRLYLVCDACFSTESNPSNFLVMIKINTCMHEIQLSIKTAAVTYNKCIAC